MNHRDQDGRHDYPGDRGRDQEHTQRESRYGRGRTGYEEHSDYSARAQQQGRGQGYQFSQDNPYGRQFSERGQGSAWSDDSRNWEYEGGPERLGSSGYDEAQRSHPRGAREQGGYGAGTGSNYGDQQRYGTQGTRDYGTASGQGYGTSGNARPQTGGQFTGHRGFEYGEHGSRGVYGGESAGYGGRASLHGEYMNEGDAGYGERASSHRYSSTTQRHDTSRSSTFGPSYRGVGPKNYRRSDERLTEDINERLTDDDYLDASEITVRVLEGKVTLEGSVDQRWMKHMAEDIADSCSGVKEVDNRIVVTSGSNVMNRGASASRTSSSGSTPSSSGTPGSSGTMPH